MLVPMKIDYGVRILVHLASLPFEKVATGSEIAKERHIPENFLFQISNELLAKNLLKSKRGPRGGYYLAKDPKKISIAEVVHSLDQSLAPVACLDSPELCIISGNCSQQDMWEDVEKILLNELKKVTVKQLAELQKPQTIKLKKS